MAFRCTFYVLFATFIVLVQVLGSNSNKQKRKRFVEGQTNENVEIDSLKQRIVKLETMFASFGAAGTGGAVFTRWGRSVCPVDIELVYSGFAAGSYFTNTGGAANYICLPNDPSNNTVPKASNSNKLYGVEYETNDFGPNSFNEDAPCAVCRSPAATTMVMIPAKKTCYTGWTIAYSGKLAAGYYAHPSASEYICVDGQPEYLLHGETNDEGKLLYPVTTHCGSLSCPPYHDGMELSCVVCLK